VLAQQEHQPHTKHNTNTHTTHKRTHNTQHTNTNNARHTSHIPYPISHIHQLSAFPSLLSSP